MVCVVVFSSEKQLLRLYKRTDGDDTLMWFEAQSDAALVCRTDADFPRVC